MTDCDSMRSRSHNGDGGAEVATTAKGKPLPNSRLFGPGGKTDPTGQVVMSMKFGAKPIEFEKGKAGIVVPSKEKVPAVIDTLIAAVRAGGLDDLFSQAAKAGPVGKARKAA
jgi:hypothetical protein